MGTEVELRAVSASDLSRAGIEVVKVDFGPHVRHGDGVYLDVAFPNYFGASVICTSRSYGGQSGLFELCVMDANGDVVKRSPVIDFEETGDYVIGGLTPAEVLDLLRRIAALEMP